MRRTNARFRGKERNRSAVSRCAIVIGFLKYVIMIRNSLFIITGQLGRLGKLVIFKQRENNIIHIKELIPSPSCNSAQE